MDKINFFEKVKINNFNHFISLNSSSNDLEFSRPAIFLDRDGVIIDDVNYISDPKDVKILSGIKELLSFSKSFGWANIVITNQSGIGRGFYTWEDYEKVTHHMLEMLGRPCNIDGIYANSNKPTDDLEKESWRKPNPNMIMEAVIEFNLNLEESIIIGDRLTDILSGYKSGLKKYVHVLTGHGRKERQNVLRFFSKSNKNNILHTLDDLSCFPLDDLIYKVT
ncbi:HAD-IIIA family hydrolase [Prochlorococcus marinus XMU1412]|uniref:D-glycero-alpha-D-manno-heptose-1,7-bisphosphate 7-phosphatase n=1 Tax=Prochlorococcus marinus TaxID=1219 RepID=UPI001AD9CB6F|nr:HAD-IIIA family hydrolase [Prochlorococcus marinus]MBO8240517.1 HAD-IIIA family hydrolase [Prochlorococcus marinus XMU1412]MBW3071751.1 haloacid dehalogenase [Prochlorococcus marinus str. MU1412]